MDADRSDGKGRAETIADANLVSEALLHVVDGAAELEAIVAILFEVELLRATVLEFKHHLATGRNDALNQRFQPHVVADADAPVAFLNQDARLARHRDIREKRALQEIAADIPSGDKSEHGDGGNDERQQAEFLQLVRRHDAREVQRRGKSLRVIHQGRSQ